MNLPDDFHREPPPRRSREGGTALIAGLILGLIVAAVVGWIGVMRPRKLEQQVRKAEAEAEYARTFRKESEQRLREVAELMRRREQLAEQGETVVEDPEGKLLWAKPEPHGALELRYLPSGTLCLIRASVGVAKFELESRKALAALGPWGQMMLARLEALTGAQTDELQSILAAIIVREDGTLDVSCQVDLQEPWTAEEIRRRFPEGTEQRIGGVDAIEHGDRVVLFVGYPRHPRETPYGRFVVCPKDLAEELVESADDPPMLVRDLEDLMRQSEITRDVTIIASTKFLEAAGGDLFDGDGEALREAFTRFVGRETTAVMLSAKWDNGFFLELRATPALGVSPRWLASTLQQRLDAAAGEVEKYVAAHQWPEYGRRVIERYPAMLRKLAEYTRHGEDNRQAVLRAYLPAVAGHNLMMGAELLLTQAGGGVDRNEVGASPANLVDATTLDERLAARMSLTFPRESLERALELWSAEAGVAAVIDGPAFEAAGITRNQSVELDLRDRPAGEVLVEILRRANPDRTATSAADSRQSVVYIVESAATGNAAADGVGGSRIIVTTRAAAAERGQPLPTVFAVGGE
jgi:hypothetical protein